MAEIDEIKDNIDKNEPVSVEAIQADLSDDASQYLRGKIDFKEYKDRQRKYEAYFDSIILKNLSLIRNLQHYIYSLFHHKKV